MARTYAVAWRFDTAASCVGKLELVDGMRLEGVDEHGRRALRVVEACEIGHVERARNGVRLRGRRALTVWTDGGMLSLASLDGPGTALELLEQLGARRR